MRYGQHILGEKTGGECPVPQKVYIYWLLEPRTRNVRYVGKTNDPRTRYHHYISDANIEQDVHLPVIRWVAKLRRQGYLPLMHLEELIPAGSWEVREQHWIAHFKAQGLRLLNILPGGGGTTGFTRPAAVRAKIAATLTGHRVSGRTREHLSRAQTGRVYDETTRERVSVANRKRWAAMTPETKAAFIAGRKKPVWTDAMRRALSEKKRHVA